MSATTFPGQTPAGDLTGLTVPALEAKTAPLPTTKAPTTKYYYCPVPNTSMFRPDGMRLVFIQGVHATELLATQGYLDKEIEEAHPYLSIATDEQVKSYKMHINPRGTIEDELRPQMERELRAKLEAEIREEMQGRGITPTVSDTEKLAGTEGTGKVPGVRSGSGTVGPAKSLYPGDIPLARTGFQHAVVGSDKLGGGAAGSASTSGSVPSGKAG